MSDPTPSCSWRTNKAGEWVVYGPAEVLQAAADSGQPVEVARKDKTTTPATITRVGKVFVVDGVDMVYGYLAPHEPGDGAGHTGAAVKGSAKVAKSPAKAKAPAVTPTAEQQQVIDWFVEGVSFKVQAYAGTGKTSVLTMAASACPDRRGRYLAFNKAIVVDAAKKMPDNVEVSTAHALAYRYTPEAFRTRMRRSAKRIPSWQIANRLNLDPIVVQVRDDDAQIVEPQRLTPNTLASFTMGAIRRFCQSGDPEPGAKHFRYIEGIDLPGPDGERRWDNNNLVRKALLPALQAAWADLCTPDGWLPYNHDHYLKHWALTDPVLPVDFVLVDEAQDLSPVLLHIVECQVRAGTQVVLVGDDFQSINGFTGAVNALSRVDIDRTAYLTQSWRFGAAIATVANKVLRELNAPKPLRGNKAIRSTVGPAWACDVVLTRTNAGAIKLVLEDVAAGGRPMLIGDVNGIIQFCRAAMELQAGNPTEHEDLSWATSWADVQAYAQQDDGEDLKLLVQLIDDFGAAVILAALEGMPRREEDATQVISTAHKVKGREWDTVELGEDFPIATENRPLNDDELMLLYVAVTRARRHCDPTNVDFFQPRPTRQLGNRADVIDLDGYEPLPPGALDHLPEDAQRADRVAKASFPATRKRR
jgi:hypothetical protein